MVSSIIYVQNLCFGVWKEDRLKDFFGLHEIVLLELNGWAIWWALGIYIDLLDVKESCRFGQIEHLFDLEIVGSVTGPLTRICSA